MGIVRLGQVIDRIRKLSGMQTIEDVPNKLSDLIVPTINVNPEKLLKVAKADLENGTSANIFTTSTKKKTYVVAMGISVSKDASNDGNFSYIGLYGESGEAIFPLAIRYRPTTAGDFYEHNSLPHPILLGKNKTMSFHHETATANIKGTATIFYYEEDEE